VSGKTEIYEETVAGLGGGGGHCPLGLCPASMNNWTTAFLELGLLLSSHDEDQEMHLLWWAPKKGLLSVTRSTALVIILMLMKSVANMLLITVDGKNLHWYETDYKFYVSNM
jgi:hypothetical protein